MKRIIILGILIFTATSGYSQDTSDLPQTNNSSFLGIGSVIYEVDNIQEARDWYAKAFETKPQIDESHYVGFMINGYAIGFRSKKEERCTKIESTVCYWDVKNIQEVYDRLVGLGAKEDQPPFDAGGEMKLATVVDPFGHMIGLSYNPYTSIKY